MHLSEESQPAGNREGRAVKVGAINEGCRGGVDTFSCSVFPHGPQVLISLAARIRGLDIGSFKLEFVSNSLGPVGDEVSLACVFHSKDSLELRVAEVTVFVIEALG